MIFNLLFKLDFLITYIFIKPENRLDEFNFKNCFENLMFHLKKKQIIRFSKLLIILQFYLMINFLKIFYLPFIILFYFSKYRFALINYTQIGALSEHLNLMFKKNFNNGYKTIFLIPSTSNFHFFSEIFKNQIVFSNIFLNIILLPLKHTQLISCKMNNSDYLYDENNLLKNQTIKSNIINLYSHKNPKCNFFNIDENFLLNMNKFCQTYFGNINFDKTFIFHQRDDFYNNTSDLRGSKISSYKLMIDYILSEGFYLIRFVDSFSQKLEINSERYIEINIDLKNEFNEYFNVKLQFYLIYVSKGLICTTSGPASIGSLFSKPVYDTNNYGPNVNSITKEGTYILKKIYQKNKILSLKDLKKIKFFEGLFASDYQLKRLGIKVVNNTENEILNGFKDFLKNIKCGVILTKEQLKFREELPEIDLKFYKSNISQSYLLKNKHIFLK